MTHKEKIKYIADNGSVKTTESNELLGTLMSLAKERKKKCIRLN